MTPRFLVAIETVLKHEGGYVNDPADPGGRTKYGISQRTYPNVDIENLTEQEAKEIYFRDWWERYGYEKIPDNSIAAKILDISVLAGNHATILALQKAINLWRQTGIDEDGILGSETINACTDLLARYDQLYRSLCHFCAEHFESLNKPRYRKGWLRRALD